MTRAIFALAALSEELASSGRSTTNRSGGSGAAKTKQTFAEHFLFLTQDRRYADSDFLTAHTAAGGQANFLLKKEKIQKAAGGLR